MKNIERLPSGIPGLDEMIGGGLPVPSITLVAGEAGTGKTTFCNQFLCMGAEHKEPGLYFMISGESPSLVFKFASTYEFVKEDYFCKEIHYIDLGEAVENTKRTLDLLDLIQSKLTEFQSKRVVICNPSELQEILKGDYRRFLLKLARMIKDMNAVSLITGETGPGYPYPADIAHIADGIILLHNTEVNYVRRRSLEILKMAGTSHTSGKHALDISAKGLTVYPGL
jgi:KaiC/GvpD/RAD55 family RecA-like ATPase